MGLGGFGSGRRPAIFFLRFYVLGRKRLTFSPPTVHPPLSRFVAAPISVQMAEPAAHPVDIEELIAYSYDLSKLLKNQNDAQVLTEALEGASQLQSSAYTESADLQIRMQDYRSKINACKQEIDQIKSMSDSEVAQRELENELQKEKQLRNELSEDIDLLDKQRASIEEQKATVNKMEKEKTITQQLLSMYASVSTIVPNLDDAAGVSGHIVDIDRNKTEKFDFDTTRIPTFEICNSLWKIVDS